MMGQVHEYDFEETEWQYGNWTTTGNSLIYQRQASDAESLPKNWALDYVPFYQSDDQ